MKRRRWTKKQRAEIFMDHGGRCYLCNEKIGVDEIYDLDHEIALDPGARAVGSRLRPFRQDQVLSHGRGRKSHQRRSSHCTDSIGHHGP